MISSCSSSHLRLLGYLCYSVSKFLSFHSSIILYLEMFSKLKHGIRKWRDILAWSPPTESAINFATIRLWRRWRWGGEGKEEFDQRKNLNIACLLWWEFNANHNLLTSSLIILFKGRIHLVHLGKTLNPLKITRVLKQVLLRQIKWTHPEQGRLTRPKDSAFSNESWLDHYYLISEGGEIN